MTGNVRRAAATPTKNDSKTDSRRRTVKTPLEVIRATTNPRSPQPHKPNPVENEPRTREDYAVKTFFSPTSKRNSSQLHPKLPRKEVQRVPYMMRRRGGQAKLVDSHNPTAKFALIFFFLITYNIRLNAHENRCAPTHVRQQPTGR